MHGAAGWAASQRTDGSGLIFCHLPNLNWELPNLVAIKNLITGVSIFSTPVPSRSATRGSRPSVSRSETRPFPPFFDISRRGHLQSNLLQSPQSSSTLSFSRFVSCTHTRWKSRPPERLYPLGSLARGEDGNHVFGECDAARLLVSHDLTGSSQRYFCTAPSGTTTSTKHHVAFGCFQLCRWVCRFNSEKSVILCLVSTACLTCFY